MYGLRGLCQSAGVADFSLYGNGKSVILSWTLDSGSTCNGIVILRASDTVNFVQAGEIQGVCGSSTSATTYTFTDCCPEVNRTMYYRLKLGLNQYSALRSIYLDYVAAGELLIKSGDAITLRFNNDAKEAFTFRLFNERGREVWRINALYEDEVIIPRQELLNAVYYYRLESVARTYKGKFLIAH